MTGRKVGQETATHLSGNIGWVGHFFGEVAQFLAGGDREK